MTILTIDTPKWKAVGEFLPERMPDRYPYRLTMHYKVGHREGQTEVRESNNTGFIEEMLKYNNIVEQFSEEWYKALGYKRTLPYGRWEKIN